jgi:hypothetical protein
MEQTGMNNATRKHIATMSDEGLELSISRDLGRLEKMGKNLKRTVGAHVGKRLQALLDEKQARMVGTSAVYDYSH